MDYSMFVVFSVTLLALFQNVASQLMCTAIGNECLGTTLSICPTNTSTPIAVECFPNTCLNGGCVDPLTVSTTATPATSATTRSTAAGSSTTSSRATAGTTATTRPTNAGATTATTAAPATCTRVGRFAVPGNCTAFTACAQASGTATRGNCGAGYRFDAANMVCQKGSC